MAKTDFSIIPVFDDENGMWFLQSDIAKTLGIGSSDALEGLYRRHASEFLENETRMVTMRLHDETQVREHRVYSEPGVILLAMLAGGAQAMELRRAMITHLIDGHGFDIVSEQVREDQREVERRGRAFRRQIAEKRRQVALQQLLESDELDLDPSDTERPGQPIFH